jgi:hypothetical protein
MPTGLDQDGGLAVRGDGIPCVERPHPGLEECAQIRVALLAWLPLAHVREGGQHGIVARGRRRSAE